MFILILCIAAMVVGAPIAAALIVTVASRREDANWSLGRPARGPLEAVARRIVAFDADSIDWPRSKAQMQAEISARSLMPEVVEATPETETRNAA